MQKLLGVGAGQGLWGGGTFGGGITAARAVLLPGARLVYRSDQISACR